MWSFFSRFIGLSQAPLTVVVVDRSHTGPPDQQEVTPRRVLYGVLLAVAALTALVVMMVVFTPLQRLMPGYATEAGADAARVQAERLMALEDTVRMQQEYLSRFRRLMSNQVASVEPEPAGASEQSERAPLSRRPVVGPPRLPEAPPVEVARRQAVVVAAFENMSGLPLPAPAPVQGFVTRGFEASTGHLGVDIATGTGSVVRTVGDGFVIFADWTYEGGHTIVVQHADGYVSVYKHNDRLLRRSGERLRARDAVAVSGNTGEISTGPHLHFELWRDGLPQDPRAFIVGW